jgi:hypothetical protein
MGRLALLTAALLAALAATTGAAEAPEDGLRAENEALRARVRRLETELEGIKARLDREAPAGDVDADGLTAALDAYLAAAPTALGGVAAEAPPRVSLRFYGYVKLDAAYDADRISVGNFARWAEPGGGSADDRFSMTARQTRLGVDVTGPDLGGVRTSAKVEIDFYGSGAENKGQPFMRHAYLRLEWPDAGLDLLAGQTWDLVSPLNPFTVNYPVAWWSGNIGYRRPQVRLTKKTALGEATTLTVAVALARNIGPTPAFETVDAGADSGLPMLQARAALEFPFLDGRKVTVGLSGLAGRMEYETDASGHHEDLDIRAASLELVAPVTSWLTLRGEVFTGENLDQVLGGIGQGVDMTTFEEIGATGGWLAAELAPCTDVTVNLGAAVDDVDDDDVGPGARTRNRSVWANVVWKPVPHVSTGFEVSHWETEYRDSRTGRALRLQISIWYSF